MIVVCCAKPVFFIHEGKKQRKNLRERAKNKCQQAQNLGRIKALLYEKADWAATVCPLNWN